MHGAAAFGNKLLSENKKHQSEMTMKLLLAKYDNVDIVTVTGKTALHIASNNHNISVVQMLLEAGADINSTCESGKSALHYAAEDDYGADIVAHLDFLLICYPFAVNMFHSIWLMTINNLANPVYS